MMSPPCQERFPRASGWASESRAAHSRSSRRTARSASSSVSPEAVEAHQEELSRGAAAETNGDVTDRADIHEISRQLAQAVPRPYVEEILADVGLRVGGDVELIVDAAARVPFHGVERMWHNIVDQRRQHLPVV